MISKYAPAAKHTGNILRNMERWATDPNSGITVQEFSFLVGELGNGFGAYIDAVINDPETPDGDKLALRRATVLFHQMIYDVKGVR